MTDKAQLKDFQSLNLWKKNTLWKNKTIIDALNYATTLMKLLKTIWRMWTNQNAEVIIDAYEGKQRYNIKTI